MIHFAIRRWQITLVLILLTVVLAGQALFLIPRSVDPHFPTAMVITTALLPGADSLEIEETISRPIEEAIQGLDDIREIRSTSVDGLSFTVTEFEHGTDAEQSFDRVVRVVGGIRDRLPRDIARISHRRPQTTEATVLQLALYDKGANARRLVKYASDIRQQLNGVPGVRSVEIYGAPTPEVRVSVNSERLAATGTPATAVVAALSRAGAVVPIGNVTAGRMRYGVKAGGAYRTLDEIRATPIRTAQGRIVRVGDVAEVAWDQAEKFHLTRVDGEDALFIAVLQKDDVDTIRLRDELMRALENARILLPPDMALAAVFDQSRDVRAKLAQLGRDFMIALALVLATLFPLGWRSALIVMASLPLSMAGGILSLWLLGYSLNQISIAGFIIALGLLVDDSIVVTENIDRHLREDGGLPSAAAARGVAEVARPVVGATAVLLFAFLPLAFLPETSGDFVRGLPMAVLVTVACSMLVSLTVIPLLAARMLRPHEPENKGPSTWLAGVIRRTYSPLLSRALERPRRWVWGSMVMCFGAFGLVPMIGFSLFPAADTSYFLVRVKTPEGSSIERTDRVVARLSMLLAHEPTVAHRLENSGAGNPQVFYNVIRREESSTYGDILVTLKEWDPVNVAAMLERLRRKFSEEPDARVSILTFSNGPTSEPPIAVRIVGEDIEVLKTLANQVERELLAQPGLREVTNPITFERPILNLRVDEEKAGSLGIPAGEARRVLRLAISGETASSLRDEEGDSWPVTVRLPMQGRPTVDQLDDVYLSGFGDRLVPLRQLVTPQLDSAPPLITRRGLRRVVTVTAYVQPGDLASKRIQDVDDRLARLHLPAGYSYNFGGEAEVARRNFNGFGISLFACLIGIVLVVLWEFGNFRETAAVLGVIPLGTLGGLIALLMTGNSLSFLALIGFIALIGIEIKNSILLVDFASQLRATGMPLHEAIARAGEVRFRPVLLTSVTAIGGLLPLALGGSALYSPIAWVIIGGLITSTLLSRIVTPLMYLLMIRSTV